MWIGPLTVNMDHAMEIWKYIVEHDNGITNFHFEIAADLLREEELELMATDAPGADTAGDRCAVDKSADASGDPTENGFCKNCQRCKEDPQLGHNIHQHLDLIAGLPYEDYDSFQQFL